MKKNTILLSLLGLTLLACGCSDTFLDAKPSTSIVQPVTLEEFQRLLDNAEIMQATTALGVLAADEYVYRSDAVWESARTATERNSYIWAKDLFEGENAEGDWGVPYSAVFYANNVLAGLDKITLTALNQDQWKMTRGWALFVRAFAYYELVKNFAPLYDAATANTDPGVPLRTRPSVDEILPRATVQQTYDLIFSDLSEATKLLGASLPLSNRNRPSKVACHALLARIFLSIGNYPKAELHADTCLQLYDKLIDYKTVSQTSTTPFSVTNDELIYAKAGSNSYIAYSASTANSYTRVSPELISLFRPGDLRLAIFFSKQADGSYIMKRNYHGTGTYPFVGLATDEVYLIKAECAARRNDVAAAMDLLNQMLIKRYAANSFAPLTAGSAADALNLVLLERRKELVWRALRWDDLKRLNKEGAGITLQRVVNGQAYKLEPGSPRYVFPIPDNEINLSGIQQNPR